MVQGRSHSQCGPEFPDGDVEIVLIAPVLTNLSVAGVVRAVESVFNAVLPDDDAANDPDSPEAATLISIRALAPFNRIDSNRLPQPLLSDAHLKSSRIDQVPKAFS
jgi:hypothetical protein